jgi:hypothetical protein
VAAGSWFLRPPNQDNQEETFEMMHNDVEWVLAKGSQMVGTPDGGWYRVNGGETRRADDPVVKAAPHLFTTDPSEVAVSSLPPGSHGDAPVQVRRG